MTVTFWGVRGSVPSPLTGKRVSEKIAHALHKSLSNPIPAGALLPGIHEWMEKNLTYAERATYGGNTTCVEVQCDGLLLILDMGTGLRELGGTQMKNLFTGRSKKLEGYILQSHVHWDHVQGFPFWAPIYARRDLFNVDMTFFGGKSWDAQLETVLAGQMNAPVFPVTLAEIRETAMNMKFATVHDRWRKTLNGPDGDIEILARKLHHPQETFGYRITYKGRTVVFTTDHEPYAYLSPHSIHQPLVELVRDADVWITDCQYTHEKYSGEKDGVQKLGWGHSFPEYIAEVARIAKPMHVITTHHDPASLDQEVEEIAKQVESLCGIQTSPAHEGLVIPVTGNDDRVRLTA